MTIYCDKCGSRHDCSACPVCFGFGLSNLQVAAGIGKSFQPTEELQTLRAKFEVWWQRLLQTPGSASYNSQMPAEGDYRGIALIAYQAAHTSRDAEVEALRKDAERYRFLRISAKISWNDWVEHENLMATDAEREQMDAAIDSAIDAAMQEKQP